MDPLDTRSQSDLRARIINSRQSALQLQECDVVSERSNGCPAHLVADWDLKPAHPAKREWRVMHANWDWFCNSKALTRPSYTLQCWLILPAVQYSRKPLSCWCHGDDIQAAIFSLVALRRQSACSLPPHTSASGTFLLTACSSKVNVAQLDLWTEIHLPSSALVIHSSLWWYQAHLEDLQCDQPVGLQPVHTPAGQDCSNVFTADLWTICNWLV